MYHNAAYTSTKEDLDGMGGINHMLCARGRVATGWLTGKRLAEGIGPLGGERVSVRSVDAFEEVALREQHVAVELTDKI